MKHAYLILAHNEFWLLQTLVNCIDDERNDIFIHIDAKVRNLPELRAQKAGLKILDKRVDVRWGDISVVEAEYELFKAAVNDGPYAYYHLLSGTDLPIKSQDYIHGFCNEHQGREFIGYTLTEITPEVVRKVQRWHMFPRRFRSRNVFVRAIRSGFLRLQEQLGIKRNRRIGFKKGSQWVSVTHDMAQYILEHRKWVRRKFRNTFCSDEIVIQTLCWQSPYRDNIYCTTSDGKGCMRAIGWRDGCLYDWTAADFDTLSGSGALFARKFNSSDWEFIEKVKGLSR